MSKALVMGSACYGIAGNAIRVACSFQWCDAGEKLDEYTVTVVFNDNYAPKEEITESRKNTDSKNNFH